MFASFFLGAAAVLTVLYLVFWYVCRLCRPMVFFQGVRITRVVERCHWLSRSYAPTIWLIGGAMHSWWARIARKSHDVIPDTLKYDREFLKAGPTGAVTVAVDWVGEEENKDKGSGVVCVLVHAWFGPHLRGCVKSVVAKSVELGFVACVMNLPGMSNLVLTSPSVLATGFDFKSELEAMIEACQLRHPWMPRAIVCFSVAGVPILNFLAAAQYQKRTKGDTTDEETGSSSLAGRRRTFDSAVFISCPMDLEEFLSSDTADTRHMLAAAQKYVKLHKEALLNDYAAYLDGAIKARTLLDFAESFGRLPHDSLSELLESSDPRPSVECLKIPTMFLYAKDDSTMRIEHEDSIGLLTLLRGQCSCCVVTETGGHCGFFAGPIRTTRYCVYVALDFISVALRPLAA